MHLAVITGTKSFINAACRHCDSGLLQYIYIFFFPLLIVGVIIRELQRCVSSCVRMTTLRPGDEGTFFFFFCSICKRIYTTIPSRAGTKSLRHSSSSCHCCPTGCWASQRRWSLWRWTLSQQLLFFYFFIFAIKLKGSECHCSSLLFNLFSFQSEGRWPCCES